MRLVEFQNAETNNPVFIAPAAVGSVEPCGKDQTFVWVCGIPAAYRVNATLGAVLTELYYKNGGGHAFGDGEKYASKS